MANKYFNYSLTVRGLYDGEQWESVTMWHTFESANDFINFYTDDVEMGVLVITDIIIEEL